MSWIVKPSYVDPGGGCNGYCKTFCGARTCVNNCSKNFCLVNLWQQRFCYQAEREANECISDKAIKGVKALRETVRFA